MPPPAGGKNGPREAAREFLRCDFLHAPADRKEIVNEPASQRRQGAARNALATYPGLDEPLSQGALGFLDAAPDIAIALAQLARTLLDRARLCHGFQNLAEAEAKRVVPLGFQPHFHPRK